MSEQESAGAIVAERLRRLDVDQGVSHGAMTLFAVFPRYPTPEGERIEYRLLSEAVADGQVVVGEHSSAVVPELSLANHGAVPVLVLGGEENVGGKQNRIVNASFLVGAAGKVALPVSCVEQGRWHPVSDRFSSGEISYFSLKRSANAQVRENLRERRDVCADQMAIWSELNDRHARARGDSDTGAMSDLFRDRDADLAAFELAFPLVAGAVGLVVALGEHVVGVEVFDQAATLARLWPRLVRSYALDALELVACGPVARDRVIRFIARSQSAKYDVYPSLALGKDVRFDGDGLLGSALVYRNQPIYITAFRNATRRSTRSGRLAPSSVRRDLPR
jgi:hypothetical protein